MRRGVMGGAVWLVGGQSIVAWMGIYEEGCRMRDGGGGGGWEKGRDRESPGRLCDSCAMRVGKGRIYGEEGSLGAPAIRDNYSRSGRRPSGRRLSRGNARERS